MVAAPAAVEAIAIARRTPSLRVGLHLALVEACPALPAADIPGLVDACGQLRRDMARFGADIFFRPAVRRQIAAEIEAQFRAFAATGLPLDHVNAHKHFHLHPTLAGMVTAACARYGARALRVPAEPARIVAAIDGSSAGVSGHMMRPWTGWLKARARSAGLLVPDQVFGLAWSGAIDRARLLALAARLPDGLTEIYTHPATSDDFHGAAPGYGYRQELAALTYKPVVATFNATGIARGGYSDAA